MEEANTPDPAAFIRFESHNHAVSALCNIGYLGAQQAAPFSPEDLVDEVNKLLARRGITVMDMTTAIPEPARGIQSASYSRFQGSCFVP